MGAIHCWQFHTGIHHQNQRPSIVQEPWPTNLQKEEVAELEEVLALVELVVKVAQPVWVEQVVWVEVWV
jgi:hypothetical protein